MIQDNTPFPEDLEVPKVIDSANRGRRCATFGCLALMECGAAGLTASGYLARRSSRSRFAIDLERFVVGLGLDQPAAHEIGGDGLGLVVGKGA